MISLLVDFNDVDQDGSVMALGRLAPRRPTVGQRAYLRDEEGNRCWGTVSRVTDRLIFVEPDWDTWTSQRERKQEPQGWWAYVAASVEASQGFSATTVTGIGNERNDGAAPSRVTLPPLVPSR
jgi:hypothetical protein